MPLILVIDDDAFVLSAMRRRLHGRYKLALCLFAKQAPKLIERLSPDLILTDNFMPDMSGIELAAWVKSHETYRDIPVILQSASNMATPPPNMPVHLAPDLTLSKSVAGTELCAAIDRLLQKRAGPNESSIPES